MKKRKEKRSEYVPGIGMTIRPRSASLYGVNLVQSKKKKSNIYSLHNLECNNHNGIISTSAGKKIESAVQWLCLAAKWKRVYSVELEKYIYFKINMITLTLPAKQKHSDVYIKSKYLNQFIVEMKKDYGLKEYVWRAEAQSNGNIHFHIITDTFIEIMKLRNMWNRIIEKDGYVSDFEKVYNHRSPNSTDVHSIKHIKKIGQYLSKYISKDRKFAKIGELRLIKGEVIECKFDSRMYMKESADNKEGKVVGSMLSDRIRNIDGRLWFCSKGLAGGGKIMLDNSHEDFAGLFDYIRSQDVKEVNHDHGKILYGEIAMMVKNYGNKVGLEVENKLKLAAGLKV